MKLFSLCRPLLFVPVMFLAACGGSGDFEDLNAFMAEVKAKPKGHIEPIPTFQPYKAFSYGATALRGPFTKPVAIKEITRLAPSSDVKPDMNRTKEFLERFNLESLAMVGVLKQNEQLWVLIDDGDGGVHRVKEGNYLGKNHGRIVEATESYLAVVEIVPNGLDGWVERPRSLKLRDSE
jgi:type IV pilus assembly protein PilP